MKKSNKESQYIMLNYLFKITISHIVLMVLVLKNAEFISHVRIEFSNFIQQRVNSISILPLYLSSVFEDVINESG